MIKLKKIISEYIKTVSFSKEFFDYVKIAKKQNVKGNSAYNAANDYIEINKKLRSKIHFKQWLIINIRKYK